MVRKLDEYNMYQINPIILLCQLHEKILHTVYKHYEKQVHCINIIVNLVMQSEAVRQSIQKTARPFSQLYIKN